MRGIQRWLAVNKVRYAILWGLKEASCSGVNVETTLRLGILYWGGQASPSRVSVYDNCRGLVRTGPSPKAVNITVWLFSLTKAHSPQWHHRPDDDSLLWCELCMTSPSRRAISKVCSITSRKKVFPFWGWPEFCIPTCEVQKRFIPTAISSRLAARTARKSITSRLHQTQAWQNPAYGSMKTSWITFFSVSETLM